MQSGFAMAVRKGDRIARREILKCRKSRDIEGGGERRRGKRFPQLSRNDGIRSVDQTLDRVDLAPRVDQKKLAQCGHCCIVERTLGGVGMERVD